MSDRFGMSLLLENQSARLVRIAEQFQAAVDGNTRQKLYKELLQMAEEMQSLSDSAIEDDVEDGIDLAELRRNALPDGSIPAQVLHLRERKGGR